MYPTIPIGPVRLQTYGLFLLIAAWIGLWLASKMAPRRGLEPDHVYNAGFYALLAGLVAARLGHVALYFETYRSQPLQIISPSAGALLPWTGLLGALLALGWYAWRNRLSPPRLADAAAFGLLAAIIIANVGAFLAGKSLGMLSDAPWAVELYAVRRHPASLYEGLAVLLWLGLLFWLERRGQRQPGWLAWLALFGYATTRLFLEPFRVEGALLADGWRVVQVVALLIVVASGWMLGRIATWDTPTHDDRETTIPSFNDSAA